MRRRLLGVLAATAALGVADPAGAAFDGPNPEPGITRPAILVGNNWDGTTDIVDPETFERLDRINVVPDREERMAEIMLDPARLGFFLAVAQLIGEGHDQLNDDVFSSHDGRTIFVSRPSFADVVAIDLASKEIVWRAPVDGYRSDHMAISPDGKRLLVSASTGNVVHELDTATGERTGVFPSGDSPHENVYSRDGERIYHAAIGRVYTPTDMSEVNAAKGAEFFQIVDNDTKEIIKRIDMGKKLAEAGYPGMSSAVRPMALAPDEKFLYFQVSFFHGFVEYDLTKDKVTRVAELPIPDKTKRIPKENYLLDSAHHGLALDRKGQQLCVAGTMADYGALVDRKTFEPTIVDDAITKPYWATNSADGRYCYISASGDDSVVVISYGTQQVVHEFDVGDHPQRVRNGVVRIDQYPQGQFGELFRLGVRVPAAKHFKGGRRRVTCVARKAIDLKLVRCRLTLKAGGRTIGKGERFKQGSARLPVTVALNKRGRKLLRAGKLRRATIIARGVDSTGRVATVRQRARLAH
jgi:DNA-binding beta-propeller fold protein YncE